MNPLQEIFDAIAAEGFSARVVALIDNYINDILYGKTSFPRFNLSEHAGLCSAGAPLIGASIVACYARASLEASSNVTSGEGSRPSNWEIDEFQEQHPANVFIVDVTCKPICIDCIVKFVNNY